ncbi:hypothetical protein [Streptomyces sp. NPDC050355]|uniref:hypothetical protein n=1 Tax=Streptomyces sp. NPDC050355 TaxID=3365609 RepID=UPI0037B52E6C
MRAVEWRGGQPVDLEAIDAVPGRDREYVALAAGHKIEAPACLPGSSTGILGTDDENDGGSVTTAAFCRP